MRSGFISRFVLPALALVPPAVLQSQPVPVRVQGDIVVEWVDVWGERGTDPSQFREPYVLSLAPNGTLYVADPGNNRIQYFTRLREVNGAERGKIWAR